MTLRELKNYINNKVLPSDFMIFLNDDADFLIKQYITELCNIAKQHIKVSSIYTAQQESTTLLTAAEDCLKIIYVDTFNERAEDYTKFENTIVVCSQIDKDIKLAVADFIVEFKAPADWQISDYAKTLCPTLDEQTINWFIKVSNSSIDRVINEVDKLKLLTRDEQKAALAELQNQIKEDITDKHIFAIVDALVNGDNLTVFNFLLHTNYKELDAVMLSNRVLSKLKTILLVTQNPTLTAADIGISDKYYNRLAREYRFGLNVEAIRQKIKFLSNFDYLLKTSQLDLTAYEKFNYLITNLYYKITY